jgi:Ran GTPase-activating protein (RanGAP) involved in mRNA processing and transport
MRKNGIEIKGAQFVANSYAVRNLTVLDLSENAILDEGFKQLTIASYLSNLNKLFVNDAGLTSLGAKYLKESRFLGRLRVLSIGKN